MIYFTNKDGNFCTAPDKYKIKKGEKKIDPPLNEWDVWDGEKWVEDEEIKKSLQTEKEEEKKALTLDWAVELKSYFQDFDVWFELPRSEREDLTELFLLAKENGEFPSFERLESLNESLYQKIQTLIKDKKISAPPQ